MNSADLCALIYVLYHVFNLSYFFSYFINANEFSIFFHT